MNRRERKAHAKACARSAEWIEALDPGSPRANDGHTPVTIDGKPLFCGHGGGGCGRSRIGRVERTRAGGTRFVPVPLGGSDPTIKRGGAHLQAGVAVDVDRGCLVKLVDARIYVAREDAHGDTVARA